MDTGKQAIINGVPLRGLVVDSLGRVWDEIPGEEIQQYLYLGYFHVHVKKYGGPHRVRVNRLVCESFHGPPPQEKPFSLHRNGNSTDNRPENLYWGDYRDNMQDCVRHGTHWLAKKTHCPTGHPYDEENTYIQTSGGRVCRACVSENRDRHHENRLRRDDFKHGTTSGYRYGCRCDECKRANNEYARVYRARKRGQE